MKCPGCDSNQLTFDNSSEPSLHHVEGRIQYQVTIRLRCQAGCGYEIFGCIDTPPKWLKRKDNSREAKE